MTDDFELIRKLYAENAEALSAGNIDALARFYDVDAVQFPPDAPLLRGWEAIREALEGQLSTVWATASVQVHEVITAGGWAFASGCYRITTAPREGGPEAEAGGNWLDVLRQQSDGSWKIARSTWTNRR